jgi:phosphoribosylformimino-5-aminoimidazole carboxamide ribotide isomerase
MDIVSALLGLYPFKSLYIADLTAIQGHGNHLAAITALRMRYPQLKILLDAGFKHPDDLTPWRSADFDLVIGSEGLNTVDQFHGLIQEIDPARLLLSLDFGTNGFLGASDILANTSQWPARIIAMTLSRVGSHQGPDDVRLGDLIHHAGDRQVIAAGGVRHIEDIKRLQQLGATGVLIASALHDGHITVDQLAQ